MAPPLIRHVSDTAFLVAQCRAIESARPDALFSDPLAARLAGEKGAALVASFPTARMTAWSVAIRTLVIDELIRAAVARGVGTVLNLGAGLDTRPYRLELPPELTWIEVDYGDVIEFKRARLSDESARVGVERVALDLADAAARRTFLAALGARGRRTLVLTEGVVPYLTEAQVGELADDVRALACVDGWIVDYLSPQLHATRDRRGQRHMQEAPFTFRPSDWFGFFAQHGWAARDVRYLPVESARHGRRPPLPFYARLLLGLLGPLIPAEKRDAFRHSMAYVLLEPS